MASEIIEYRGYELHINPQGHGLKVGITFAGAFVFNPEFAHSADKSRREQLLAEAKAVVDALLDPPHIKKRVED